MEETKEPVVEAVVDIVPQETTAAPVEVEVEPVAETAVVAGLDGYCSCMRCGRDETPVYPLTVKGSEKLCSSCYAKA